MEREPFPTDLTNEQWERIAPLILAQGSGGRPRTLDMRAMVNAMLHLARTRCGWRNLPDRYPNPSSVRTYYDRWHRDGTWGRTCAALGCRRTSKARRAKGVAGTAYQTNSRGRWNSQDHARLGRSDRPGKLRGSG